ncbi:MAG TPA: hypothetical protein VIK01_16180 [Polyangiaceae bacterium]
MSSKCRSLARAARRDPPASHQEAALMMIEATSRAELEEVFAAIEAIHVRYCSECRARGPLHMHVETLLW